MVDDVRLGLVRGVDVGLVAVPGDGGERGRGLVDLGAVVHAAAAQDNGDLVLVPEDINILANACPGVKI